MKAVVLTAYGDVDKLQLRDMPNPHASPDAIVVRMAGASINPVDWKMRTGAARDRFPVSFPGILGRDVSGEVVEVGEGVTKFHVGDHVLGLVRGSYAELVTAPASSWAKIPEALDVTEAGALPLVLLTGAQLIEEAIDVKAGDKVLVTGAVGSVGRVAVYTAKARGAKVWGGVRAKQREEAMKLGLEGVVALDTSNGQLDGADIAALPLLDAIADTVGGLAIQRLLGKLKPGGIIGSVVGEPPGITGRGIVVHTFLARADAEMLARLVAAVAADQLEIPIAQKMPLDKAPEAQAIAEKRHPQGKVLLLGGSPRGHA